MVYKLTWSSVLVEWIKNRATLPESPTPLHQSGTALDATHLLCGNKKAIGCQPARFVSSLDKSGLMTTRLS